jgi:glycosyltransferase involved in cell wall biosynthesis
MKDVLITIGLPVVKSKFFKKSIEACLAQTYENIEIIVQNNAKDQDLRQEIRHIITQFKDNRIFYNENNYQIPMVKNWNSILDKAKGKYFTILCDDDFWEPTFLAEMILLSEEFTRVNIFHSRIAVINEENIVKKLGAPCPMFEDGLDFIHQTLLGKRNSYLSDFLIKSEELKRIGGFVDLPDGWGSDTITWFQIAQNGGVAYSNKILYYYRDNQFNTTNSFRLSKKFKAIDEQEKIIRKILNNSKYYTNEFHDLKLILISQTLGSFKSREKEKIIRKFLSNNLKFPKKISQLISIFFRILN